MLLSPRSNVPGVRLRSVSVTRKARCRRGERLGWAQYHWFMEASSYPTLWVSRPLAMDLENLIFPLLSQSGARPSRSTSLLSELHSDAFPSLRSFARSISSPSLRRIARLNVLLLALKSVQSGSSASLRSLTRYKLSVPTCGIACLDYLVSVLALPCPGFPMWSKSSCRSRVLLVAPPRACNLKQIALGKHPRSIWSFFEKF